MSEQISMLALIGLYIDTNGFLNDKNKKTRRKTQSISNHKTSKKNYNLPYIYLLVCLTGKSHYYSVILIHTHEVLMAKLDS